MRSGYFGAFASLVVVCSGCSSDATEPLHTIPVLEVRGLAGETSLEDASVHLQITREEAGSMGTKLYDIPYPEYRQAPMPIDPVGLVSVLVDVTKTDYFNVQVLVLPKEFEAAFESGIVVAEVLIARNLSGPLWTCSQQELQNGEPLWPAQMRRGQIELWEDQDGTCLMIAPTFFPDDRPSIIGDVIGGDSELYTYDGTAVSSHEFGYTRIDYVDPAHTWAVDCSR